MLERWLFSNGYQPITTYTGKVVPLFNDNIDTDQIIPKVHLKRITKSGFGPFAFDEWRYLPDGTNNQILILINLNSLVLLF